MAETDDKESKTEEPTEKRINEAIEKGNIPIAREATLFGSMVAILAGVLLFGTWAGGELALSLQAVLASAGTTLLEDNGDASALVVRLVQASAIAVLPLFAIIAFGTIVASLMQNPPAAASDRVTPKLNRVSPLSGWQRLFGKAGLVEFVKASVKIVAVSVIVWIVTRSQFTSYTQALEKEPGLLVDTLIGMFTEFMLPVIIFALLLAIADMAWSRFKWRRDLRMTKQEVKEEFRQAEGDPHLKARLRSIGRQRSSQRMLAKLPTATMVVVNPTHYAVALRYVREDGGAPEVVAKGVDFLALRIREIAEENAIPLVENKPLARALYDQVEVGTQIPPDFYQAVAEIIHYLHRSRKLKPRA